MLLPLIPVIRNSFEVDFSERELFKQNPFDYSLVNAENSGNRFL
jgi:hypothetical protein